MKASRAILAVALLAPFVFVACESTESTGSVVVSSADYSGGFHDPWYYGGYWDSPDLIVTPPPARPEQPIAKPPPVTTPRPTPLPSIPATPRPMPRPAMRR